MSELESPETIKQQEEKARQQSVALRRQQIREYWRARSQVGKANAETRGPDNQPANAEYGDTCHLYRWRASAARYANEKGPSGGKRAERESLIPAGWYR